MLMSACVQNAVGVEQLRRLVDIQQRIMELSKHLPAHHGASHHSSCQPGSSYPFLSIPPSPVRRTSAPATCLADPPCWMDCRLRSQSLSSTASSNSSSPGVEMPCSRALDRGAPTDSTDHTTVAQTFFLPRPSVDRLSSAHLLPVTDCELYRK